MPLAAPKIFGQDVVDAAPDDLLIAQAVAVAVGDDEGTVLRAALVAEHLGARAQQRAGLRLVPGPPVGDAGFHDGPPSPAFGKIAGK